jgi:hypothetical protein
MALALVVATPNLTGLSPSNPARENNVSRSLIVANLFNYLDRNIEGICAAAGNHSGLPLPTANSIRASALWTANAVDWSRDDGSMSDGSTRRIKLTPMIHNDRQVVELDGGHISYMGLNGTTTNGTLMVQLREVPEELRGQCEAQAMPKAK